MRSANSASWRARLVCAVVACSVACGAGAAEASSFVLGPGLERALQRALEGGGALEGRWTFGGAELERDRVRVRFQGPGAGETLSATLVRPADGARAFDVVELTPASEAAAGAALQARLDAAGLTPWTEVSEAKAPAGGVDEVTLGARREIDDALRAWHVGDQASARSRLDALRTDARRLGRARAELAEAYWRIGDADAGRAQAALARDEAREAQDAAGTVRADILAGNDLTAGSVREVLETLEALCAAGPVAEAYDAVGARAEGLELLEAAAAAEGCDAAVITLTDWLIDASRFEDALRVSEPLMQRDDTTDVRARRARALMALGKPREAAEMLEPVAWASTDSGLISSLLGAYNRVPDPAWQKAKREALLARAEADPGDHVARFLAGVLLHYEGQFERSDTMLKPLLPVFGRQPRLFIYLGMNAFNLGRRDEALALIEQAMALEAPDPDVFYCRAEIYRWSDPALALADLDRYLAEERGSATNNERKTERVVRMRALLAECVAQGAPIPCVGPWEHPHGHEANRDPVARAAAAEGAGTSTAAPAWWPWVAGALVLAGAGAAWIAARRRRTDGRA
jgi:thioredoxin-like negative regulator of GroEL